MSKTLRNFKPITGVFLVLAAVGLYIGWREFYFLTDDAFIAFRYVSNSILGHGFVWNPPPFRPVEGYTSFLWVLILDFVWRLFGVQPPDAVNVLSLLFSFGAILLVVSVLLRMKLNDKLIRYRSALIALVLAGLLLNTTFLTWTSSGLETALFNFCFTAWIVAVISGNTGSNKWKLAVTTASSAVYLARPDGILVVISTILILLLSVTGDYQEGRINFKWVLSVLPILIPPLHLIWRRSFYGEWLPNTFYAKHVAAWPQSGIRYLTSFILEYGVWVWVIALIAAIIIGVKKQKKIGNGLTEYFRNIVLPDNNFPGQRLCTIIAVATLCFQVGYYTFSIGGDHFEWRVYSHLPPLILLSFVYFMNKMNIRPMFAISSLVALIVFSLPIPWVHHFYEKKITSMKLVDTLQITAADKLPFFLWPLAKPDDILQKWLTDHLVCIRRQEHKLFYERQVRKCPSRSLVVPEYAGKYPTAYFTTVGVPGWVFPKVAIIDGYGLNDYVIARFKPAHSRVRSMAHERYPPYGYYESFEPNVELIPGGQAEYFRRPAGKELTAEKIKALEKYWDDKIVKHIDVPEGTGPFIDIPRTK